MYEYLSFHSSQNAQLWGNNFNEGILSPKIIKNISVQTQITSIDLSPCGNFLATSDNSKIVITCLQSESNVYEFKPEINENAITTKTSIDFMQFVTNEDNSAWQYLLFYSEKSNNLRLYKIDEGSDWKLVGSIIFVSRYKIRNLRFEYLTKLSCLLVYNTERPCCHLIKLYEDYAAVENYSDFTNHLRFEAILSIQLRNLNHDQNNDNHFSEYELLSISMPNLNIKVSDTSSIISGTSNFGVELGDIIFYGISDFEISEFTLDIGQILNYDREKREFLLEEDVLLNKVRMRIDEKVSKLKKSKVLHSLECIDEL